jgi:protein associated with RNAse G/E
MTSPNIDSRFMKWMVVQAYKHDGLLHRQWSPAYLTVETPAYWALCSKASLVTENDGRRWMTNEHAVFILFKKRWMNVICMMRKDKGVVYYVNVATPTILDQGFLKYIDYDLDVKLFPDQTMKELDEKEFEQHVLTYGYTPDLTSAIRKSFEEIKQMMEQKEFPFLESDVALIYQKFLNDNQPFKKTFSPKEKK